MNMHTAVAQTAFELPGLPAGMPHAEPMPYYLPGISGVEVKEGCRKVPVGKVTRITGWHPIRRGHPAITFDSALERDFLGRLVNLAIIDRAVSQPKTVYYDLWGDPRYYTTDYEIWLRYIPRGFELLGIRETHFFVEVKHTKLLDECSEQLEYGLAALRMGTGVPVYLFTDVEIHARHEEYFHV